MLHKKVRNQDTYKRTNVNQRISVLYDHCHYGIAAKTLANKYNINASTVGHIIFTYRNTGRINVKKYKRVGNISKKKRLLITIDVEST